MSISSNPAAEQLYEEVSSTFWTVFFFYIVASVIWVMYCCISHRIEMELVENKIEENGIARSAEIQRLLHAYNQVNISEDQPVEIV